MRLRVCLLLLFAAPQSAAALIPLDSSGYTTLIRANRGRAVLISFWASWCGPCREELPRLAQIARQSRGEVRLIAISADEPEQAAEAERILRLNRIPGPYYRIQVAAFDDFIHSVDPEWSGVLPTLFVFDREGSAVGRSFGETPQARLERLTAFVNVHRSR